MIEARRPKILVLHKKKKKLILGVAIPENSRINEKEKEKIEKYHDLQRAVSIL